MVISVVTTVLRADAEALATARSVHSAHTFEHVITVASPIEPLDGGLVWPTHCRLVRIPGCGISAGFNGGIERARGEYIYILNSGDLMGEIDSLIDLLDAHPNLDFAYGNVLNNGKFQQAADNIDLRYVLWHGLGFCHGAAVIRRSLHQRLGLYDPSYLICMDMDFICRALAKGAQSRYLDCIAVALAPAGISGSVIRRSRENARIARGYLGPFRACFLFAKWCLASWISGRRLA